MLITLSTLWLHIFSSSRVWLEHTAWASQHTTQSTTAGRIHIISIWCKNWCPKHDHTICLAFYFPAILLHCGCWHKFCQVTPCDNSNGIISKQGHPSSKKQEGGRAWGAQPPQRPTHAPYSQGLLLFVLRLAQTGVCTVQGTACAGSSALHRAVGWFLSGVCSAGATPW